MNLTPKNSFCVKSSKDKRESERIQTFLLENLKDYLATIRMLERLITFNRVEIKNELRKLIRAGKVIAIGVQTCLETGYRAQYYSASPNILNLVNKYPDEADSLIFDCFVRKGWNPFVFHFQDTRKFGGYRK